MTVCAIVIAPGKGCDPNGQVVNTPLGFQTIPATLLKPSQHACNLPEPQDMLPNLPDAKID